MRQQSKAKARRDLLALVAGVALMAFLLFDDIITVTGLATGNQTEGWRVLAMSWLGGAVAFAILALTVRNPDGTIFTTNPRIVRQNRRRIKQWTGGTGFAMLLSLGLLLGASRGMFLVVLLGALTGFGTAFCAVVLYAHFMVNRRGLRGRLG